VNHYQTWDYELWVGYHQPWDVLYPGYDTYLADRVGRYLSASQENLYGLLEGTTCGYSGKTLVGETIPRVSVPLTREPLVVH
jgi:hypothetical protein